MELLGIHGSQFVLYFVISYGIKRKFSSLKINKLFSFLSILYVPDLLISRAISIYDLLYFLDYTIEG